MGDLIKVFYAFAGRMVVAQYALDDCSFVMRDLICDKELVWLYPIVFVMTSTDLLV